jgi:hypothetical protein
MNASLVVYRYWVEKKCPMPVSKEVVQGLHAEEKTDTGRIHF